MRYSRALLVLAFLVLSSWPALAIDTTQVNLAATMPPDGTVTITRVGDDMTFADGGNGGQSATLSELLAGGSAANVTWGDITGALAENTLLSAALNAKAAGPASSVDGGVALFSGTGGKVLQGSSLFRMTPSLASVALGSLNNSATGVSSIALGNACVTSGSYSQAIGDDQRVGGLLSSAIGYHNRVYSPLSYALGFYLTARNGSSWLIGENIVETAINTMCLNFGPTTATMEVANRGALMGGNWGVNTTNSTATLAVHGSVYLDGAIYTAHRSALGAVAYLTSAGAVAYRDTATSGTCLVVGSDGRPMWGARGGASGGTVASSRWATISASAYTAAPVNSYIIAMSNTSGMKTGLPIRYTSGAGTGYGIILGVTTNAAIAVSGHCLNSTQSLTLLEVGQPEMAVTVELFNAGLYGDAANTTLLASDQHAFLAWRQSKAHLVQFWAIHRVNDGTAQPYVNLRLNGARAYKGNGLQVGTVWNTASPVATWPTACTVSLGTDIDLECQTAGTAGNAQDLTCEAVFVLE